MRNHPGKKAVSRRLLKQNTSELGKVCVQSEEQKRTSTLTTSGEDHKEAEAKARMSGAWKMDCVHFLR